MRQRRSKDEILRVYRALMDELGRPPGKGTLLKRAGIKESEIVYYWPQLADLAAEAGAKAPNVMQAALSDDEVFADFAQVCHHLRKIPTAAELRIATRQLQTRTHTVAKRFGSLSAFVSKFRGWVEEQSDPDLHSLLALSGWERVLTVHPGLHSELDIAGPPPPIRPFLPAGLQWLEILARGDRPEYEDPITPIPLLFERRVSDAFRCLGFEVRQLGQGRGRQADCLAIARSDGYAVIVDAKVRSDRYALGTEDRKFFEYADTHGTELSAQGIKRIYLVVVAFSFRDSDADKLREYMIASPVRGVALFTVSALLRRVEGSIRDRCRFALRDLEPEFASNRVLAV